MVGLPATNNVLLANLVSNEPPHTEVHKTLMTLDSGRRAALFIKFLEIGLDVEKV